jgi:hypothetical protein
MISAGLRMRGSVVDILKGARKWCSLPSLVLPDRRLSVFFDVLIRGLFLLCLFCRRFRTLCREQGMETTEGIG